MGILVDSFGLKTTKMLQVKVHIENLYKNYFRDLSGGSVVKSPPSKARGVSSIPGWENKITQATWGSQIVKKIK